MRKDFRLAAEVCQVVVMCGRNSAACSSRATFFRGYSRGSGGCNVLWGRDERRGDAVEPAETRPTVGLRPAIRVWCLPPTQLIQANVRFFDQAGVGHEVRITESRQFVRGLDRNHEVDLPHPSDHVVRLGDLADPGVQPGHEFP